MSVTLKLSDEDAQLAARLLAAAHFGFAQAQAFRFDDLKDEILKDTGSPIRAGLDTSDLLMKRRYQLIGDTVNAAFRHAQTDPNDVIRLAHAFETTVLANARG